MIERVVIVAVEGLQPAHLSTLADRSRYFTNVIASSPFPSAAIAGYITGQWPQNNGIYELFNRGLRTSTLFTAAKQRGFSTLLKTDLPLYIGPFLGFTRDVDDFLISGEDPLPFLDSKPTFALIHLRCLPPAVDAAKPTLAAWLETLVSLIGSKDYLVAVVGMPVWDHAALSGPEPSLVEDDLLRLPMFFLGTGISGGRAREERVRTVDLAPTVQRLVGWTSRRHYDGTALDLSPQAIQGADRNALAQAFAPLPEPLARFTEQAKATGRKTGHLSHTLRAECLYAGSHRLSRYYPARGNLTCVLHRCTPDGLLPAHEPERMVSMAAQLSGLTGQPLSHRSAAQVPSELRLQLQAIGYRI
jgi:hypothetical protein